MTTIEHTKFSNTHFFWIASNSSGAFVAEFRPLNPKTGKAWQASHRITEGADATLPNWGGRLIAYSTMERAQAAITWQIERLAKRVA